MVSISFTIRSPTSLYLQDPIAIDALEEQVKSQVPGVHAPGAHLPTLAGNGNGNGAGHLKRFPQLSVNGRISDLASSLVGCPSVFGLAGIGFGCRSGLGLPGQPPKHLINCLL